MRPANIETANFETANIETANIANIETNNSKIGLFLKTTDFKLSKTIAYQLVSL